MRFCALSNINHLAWFARLKLFNNLIIEYNDSTDASNNRNNISKNNSFFIVNSIRQNSKTSGLDAFRLSFSDLASFTTFHNIQVNKLSLDFFFIGSSKLNEFFNNTSIIRKINFISSINDLSVFNFLRLKDPNDSIKLDNNMIIKFVHLFLGNTISIKNLLAYNCIRNIDDLKLLNLNNLTTLCLSGNNLESIEMDNYNGLFNNNLRTLNLASNKLKKIKNLNDFLNLTELNLGYNYDLFDIDDSILKLKNLRVLKISNNKLTTFPNQISHLSTLEELNLATTQIVDFANCFDKLVNLKSLNLSGNYKIIDLPVSCFKNLYSLTYLNLGFSRIGNLIENGQSCLLYLKDSLKNLELGSTNITCIGQALNQLKNLEYLNLYNNKIRKIENLSNLSNLRKLNLSYNYLTQIENLPDNENLAYLDLHYNTINAIKNLNNCPALKELDLSQNVIRRISNINKLNKLKVLKLNSNHITEFDLNCFENLSSLKNLNLSYNKISKITNLNDINIPSIKNLNLFYNKLKDFNISGFNNLETLNLSFNKFKSLNSIVIHRKLKDLILSNNLISKIEFNHQSLCELSKTNNLKRLNLSNNALSKIENLELLSNLQSLVLSYNQIAKIENLPANLNRLEHLFLSHNNIQVIEGLENLEKLKKLHLNFNKISKMENLSCLKHLQELELSDNNVMEQYNLDSESPYILVAKDTFA
ncbi:leucine-rich repeat domain-containing protein [Ascoidea rubescens DSM 1968]|uniref:L domain-like protein n=1 Tax=Ascoidea rubescens DSM 1968 TaxID=1344418 RepID=A0A1D2VKX6_9ASCO|nr:L domain-like protein [Ascoidea rubescens DSM 1968]ODV62197.1 L domain-like protein [Ascoidea rubescens DSM 1968]